MSRPKKYDESLRQALISSAAVSIARGGVESLTVRALANQHGCSTTVIYSMFGSKQALVQSVVMAAVESFTAAQLTVKPGDDPIEDLYRLCVVYRSWALRYPALYGVIFGGRLPIPFESPSSPDSAAGPIRPLTGMVQRAIDEGAFMAAPVSVVTHSAWASVHGTVSVELNFLGHLDRATRDELFSAHMDAALRGWMTDPSRRPPAATAGAPISTPTTRATGRPARIM